MEASNHGGRRSDGPQDAVSHSAECGRNLLLIYGTGGLLTVYGIALQVGDGFGSLNIADGSYNFTTTFAGTGTGSFFATPGPAPGTGLAGFAALILAGAAVRARGLLAR